MPDANFFFSNGDQRMATINSELSQHWQHDVDSYCQVQPRDGAEEQHSPDKPLLLLWFGQNFKSRQLVSHRISRRFTRMFCSCRDNHFGTNRISSREGLHQSQISVPKKIILKMLTFFFLNYRLVSLNCFFFKSINVAICIEAALLTCYFIYIYLFADYTCRCIWNIKCVFTFI